MHHDRTETRDRARAAALTRVRADAERVRRLADDLERARDDLAGSVALAREVGVPVARLEGARA